MMGAVRFAKRIGPARDRPLDAKGVGVHSIGLVQSTFAQLGRARAQLEPTPAVPCPRASLAELVDDRTPIQAARHSYGASLAVVWHHPNTRHGL